MVRRPVFSDQACPVETHDYMQILQGHIMYHHIVSPLHERGIDVAERNHPLLGQSCRERYGMSFGYPHIERPLGEGFHQEGHRAASRHRRRYAHNPWVFLSQLYQRMPENILIKLRGIQVMLYQPFARLFVETPRCVPLGSRLLGGLEAFALLCLDMKEFRTFQILDVVQDFDEITHIVPIDRTEVANAEALEQVVLLGQQGFQAIIEAEDIFAPVFVDQLHLPESAIDVIAHLVISLAGCNIHEILAKPTYIVVDSHIVVVEYNQKIVRIGRRVVQPFVGQSAGHRPVANDGNHVPVIFFLQGRSHRDTHRSRNRVRRVPRDESVIFALLRIGETAYPAHLAKRMESLAAPGQYLVSVGLMADVPDDAVVGRAENIMQRHGQLYRPQARPEVPGILG